MATFLKKLSPFLLLLAIVVVLTTYSCNSGGEKGAWIPVPPDTSKLAKINHFIPMEELDKFKVEYAVEREILSRTAPDLYIPVSEAFNKQALIDILKDPKSVGLRVYYGLKRGEKGQRNEFRLILVGVDEQGKDLYINQGNAAATQAPPGGKGGAEYGQCTPPCLTGGGN